MSNTKETPKPIRKDDKNIVVETNSKKTYILNSTKKPKPKN